MHINDFSEKKFCMGQVGYFGSKLGRLYNSGWDLRILLYILHNGWGQEACKWFSEIFFFNLMRLYIYLTDVLMNNSYFHIAHMGNQ